MSFINKVLLPIILIISFISIAWGENIIPSEVQLSTRILAEQSRIKSNDIRTREIRNVNLLD